MTKCSTCEKHDIELRPVSGLEGQYSCGICRALDRVRGLTNRSGREYASEVLGLLRDVEGQLRDCHAFKGPQGGRYVCECAEDPPENISSLLQTTPKKKPSPSQPAQRAPPAISGSSASAAGKGKTRKKANKGVRCREWKRTHHLISRAKYGTTLDADAEYIPTFDTDLD